MKVHTKLAQQDTPKVEGPQSMDNSSYISLSLASALQRSMDVTANNLANLNTAGFKSERSVFESIVLAQGDIEDGDDVSFVQDAGSYIDTRAGALVQTGNSLDFAVEGDGWFGYALADGKTAVGRDGQMTVDAQGFLVTTAGARMLDAGGAPIAVPPDAGMLTAGTDGTLTTAAGDVVARIGVFAAPDIQGYVRLGNGMLGTADGAAPALQEVDAPRVAQGFLEQSNVEPVTEMTRMMEVQRAYERAMRLVDDENTLRQNLLQRVGQQPA